MYQSSKNIEPRNK